MARGGYRIFPGEAKKSVFLWIRARSVKISSPPPRKKNKIYEGQSQILFKVVYMYFKCILGYFGNYLVSPLLGPPSELHGGGARRGARVPLVSAPVTWYILKRYMYIVYTIHIYHICVYTYMYRACVMCMVFGLFTTCA